MRALVGPTLVAAAVALSATSAGATDRATHAAVGAVAGAVVAGPIGFIGGGVLGYVAGRQISCDLGVERCRRYARYRRSSSTQARAPAPRRAEQTEHFRGPGDIGRYEDHGNY